jgi:hypothetical protein
MDLKKIGWDGKDVIHMTQHIEKWLALLNTVMIFRVPKILGIS